MMDRPHTYNESVRNLTRTMTPESLGYVAVTNTSSLQHPGPLRAPTPPLATTNKNDPHGESGNFLTMTAIPPVRNMSFTESRNESVTLSVPTRTATPTEQNPQQPHASTATASKVTIPLPDRLRGYNVSAGTWNSIAKADSFTITKQTYSSPSSLACCGYCLPTVGILPTTYTVYRGKGSNYLHSKLFRVHEVNTGSCCCLDRQLEILEYIPLPGDPGHSDFSHLAEDIRIHLESFSSEQQRRRGSGTSTAGSDAGGVAAVKNDRTNANKANGKDLKREIAVHNFYKKNAVLFTVRSESHTASNMLTCLSWLLCGTYNCTCMNYFPCCNCLPCGTVSVHANKSNTAAQLLKMESESALLGATGSPWASVFSCCCVSSCLCCGLPHMDFRDELVELNSKSSRFAQLVSICFHGGWDKDTGHIYQFPMSFTDSKLKKGDFGVVSKMKRTLFAEETLCRVQFDVRNMSEITAEQKMTVLGTQLMLL
jgi:hypothetical protein